MYNSPTKYTTLIDTFYGYNHNMRAGTGEFYDMKNLTSSYYPMLSTRHNRADLFVSGSNLQCLCAHDKLMYVNGGKLYYGDETVTGIELNDIDEERKIVSMGAYVIFFPDKIYVNTNDLTEHGSIDASFSTTSGETVTFTLCDVDGTDYSDYTSSETEPESPENGDLWLDTSTTPSALKEYSDYSDSWVDVLTTYVKISYAGIGEEFSQYDGVTISGAIDTQFNTTTILKAVSDNYIVVTGLINSTTTQTAVLTVKREAPDMEYFCEGENRIWGCNSEKNEIYACKLGDFKNWNCFQGVSTDSYAVSVGTDGDFTGAIRYQSTILFFKENYIHKIYNVNPPFQVSTSPTKGVQKGSWRSLSIVNGSLFYLSTDGICSYEGAVASPIDEVTGTIYYHSGVGGSFRNKYYLSVVNSLNVLTKLTIVYIDVLGIQIPVPIPEFNEVSYNTLFVYDTSKALWHKEDNIKVLEFVNHDSNLYFIRQDENTRTLCLSDSETMFGKEVRDLSIGVGYVPEKYFDWSAETGLIGLEFAGYKYITAVSLRLKLTDTGISGHPAIVRLYAEYDSSEKWELLGEIKAQETHGYTLPCKIPVRCDHMRLRIEGVGECKIYSISLETEEASNL